MATSPNAGSLTCDQAAQKAEQVGDLTCKDLDDANKDARDNELEPADTPEGLALTTAVRKVPGSPAKLLRAVSSKDAPKKQFRDRYAKTVKHRWGAPCGGKRKYDAQRKNDSETKLLHPAMRAGGGRSIKMKIYHQGSDGVADEMPCIQCETGRSRNAGSRTLPGVAGCRR